MRDNIPTELKEFKQWVAADHDKIPRIPTQPNQLAAVDDPATWGSYEEACASGLPHIGFVLADTDPFVIIDLDDKETNPATPEQKERHKKIMESFDTYTELSTSKRGYHLIIKGSCPHGRHRDNVEVYGEKRFMICTGDVVNSTSIGEFPELLEKLLAEMPVRILEDLPDYEEVYSDRDIIDRATNAVNGEKFIALCSGDMTGYPSQSEADLALMSFLTCYSVSNEQCRRLFRMSALGKRDKAGRNNTYLDYTLARARPPQVDLSNIKPSFDPPPAPIIPDENNFYPPGLLGDLARYFYGAAVRPVHEVALGTAIGFMAGIAGRSYNISGIGLNQYIIILARTGSGKDGIHSGVDSLLGQIRSQIPVVDQFIGPAVFASGQALIRVLSEKPCFVSLLGEIGATLQTICRKNASSAEIMLKKVLLDVYNRSGWHAMLRSSAYSDTEKNTKLVQAPALTILGESAPEAFYESIDSSHIAEGLIPRFINMEYKGPRPPRNKNPVTTLHPALLQNLVTYIGNCLTSQQPIIIQMDQAALLLLDDFDREADDHINGSNNEVNTQLWNRAHLKALKLSALIATGINPYSPIITQDIAQWAIAFERDTDIQGVLSRFQTGEVGAGDEKQVSDLRRVIKDFFHMGDKVINSYSVPRNLVKEGVIPYGYLSRRTISMASFRHDRLGATSALKKLLGNFIDSGLIIPIDQRILAEKYLYSGVAYQVSKNWSE